MTNSTNPLLAALEPCPFCKGKGVMRRDDDPQYPWYVTFDHEPDCVMYAIPTDLFRSFETDAQAASAWNRRALSSAPAVGETVDEITQTFWKVLAYDQLLRMIGEMAPGSELFAGEMPKVDAAYDDIIASVKAVLPKVAALAHPTAPAAGEGEAMREAAAKIVDEHGQTWGLAYRSMTDTLSKAIRAIPSLSQPAGDALLHDKEK